MTTPEGSQLTSLAVDGGGEVICAGAFEPFNIFVWSLRTGRLLDILSGHEGPIQSLSFSCDSVLASASWDKTVRLWNPYKSTTCTENWSHPAEVLAVAFRPDGKEICSACEDGQLRFFDCESGKLLSVIHAKRDIGSGRLRGDAISAEQSSRTKCFTSVCYTADGACILAGGQTKFVCIYEISQGILLKKYQVSHNRSLDGILDELNSKLMTEAGSLETLEDELNSDSDAEDHRQAASVLPGVTRGDLSKRSTQLEVRTKCVRFSPTGTQWAAASTEGLLIYSLDDSATFSPFELTVDITSASVKDALREQLYSKALMMSLHLNDANTIRGVLERIPADSVGLVAKALPTVYIKR